MSKLTKETVLKKLAEEIRHCRHERKRLGTDWQDSKDASWEIHQNEGYLSGLQYAESLVKSIG